MEQPPPKPLSLAYYSPAPHLRQWVSGYYIFDTTLPFLTDTLRAELPQVRMVIEGDLHFTFGNGPTLRSPLNALCGPTKVATRFDAAGPFRLFGAGILPAGWAALIGADADGFADAATDFAAVGGNIVEETRQRMGNAAGAAAVVALADEMFGRLARHARQPPLWFTRAADAWLSGSRDPDVSALVSATGMSARQVERMAQRVYGASPKMLARKYRTLQAAVRLGLNPDGGWEAAAGDVYFDQSHFIRDFKRFVGMTPGAFLTPGAPWLERLNRAKSQQRQIAPMLSLVS